MMTTLREVKQHFQKEGTRSVSNNAAGYTFVKRADGLMLQQDEKGDYKFYRTFSGFCRAVLWRIKRG